MEKNKVDLFLKKTFKRLVAFHGLNESEGKLLLGIDEEYKSPEGALHVDSILLDPDKRLRIMLLLNIHGNLRVLFPNNPEVRRSWLKTKRESFGGQSAIEFISNGPIENSTIRILLVNRFLSDSVER